MDSRGFWGGDSSLGSIGSVDLATCTEAVDARLVLATARQCCRGSLAARPPSGGTRSDNVPLVSLPLAVPLHSVPLSSVSL